MFHRVDWSLDDWDFTDPVKDRVGEKMDMASGIIPRGKIISKRGVNIYKVDRQNAQEKANAECHGMVYDCYASQTDGSGTMQKIEEKVILE